MSEKGISAIAIRTQLEDQALGPVHDASLLAVVALLLLRKLPMLAIASLFFLGAVPNAEARENHNRTEFVPNPQCTIGEDWDPKVDEPSDAALMQLAPTGSLRVGGYRRHTDRVRSRGAGKLLDSRNCRDRRVS